MSPTHIAEQVRDAMLDDDHATRWLGIEIAAIGPGSCTATPIWAGTYWGPAGGAAREGSAPALELLSFRERRRSHPEGVFSLWR